MTTIRKWLHARWPFARASTVRDLEFVIAARERTIARLMTDLSYHKRRADALTERLRERGGVRGSS